MCNRLVLFSHFMGVAIEHGLTIANPAFWTYAHYFPSTAADLLCRFPSRSLPAPRGTRRPLYRATERVANVLYRLQQRQMKVPLIRLRRDQSLDLDSPAFLALARRHRLLFVQDWFFRGPLHCERHRDAIRSFFTPWEHHLTNVRALLAPVRQRGRFLVGVHVRHGDYARYKDGRYFYSFEHYAEVMKGVLAAFPGEKVAFLVCSDSPVPADAFADFDVVYGNGHELEDLYALAACDRLIGPPSTYGQWASFYGDVPRYEMIDPPGAIDAGAFRVDRDLMMRSPATWPTTPYL
jgi:hypothetical protein